ncbi:hypothetical protein [Trichormus variabilis]|uniref:hypothetical protein n=1 Tax=Anabaena variabilis TaxID=264691 RepID=UPI001F5596DF|nr:hypothetical protein [Trichormus variabilis]
MLSACVDVNYAMNEGGLIPLPLNSQISRVIAEMFEDFGFIDLAWQNLLEKTTL